MDAGELSLFTAAVRQAVSVSTGADLDAALGELGWEHALEAAPTDAIAALFLAQGVEGATSSSLHKVLAAGLGLGAAVVTPVLLPALPAGLPPGTTSAGRLRVDGLMSASLVVSDRVLVAAREGGSDVLAEVAISSLELREMQGLDPAANLLTVTGELELPELVASGSWVDALAGARLALAFQLIGCGQAMLAMAREHALSRVQFGKPISSFQALRHRLADTYVELESALSLAVAAGEEGGELSAAMAKAVAGRAARTATRHCQQVLAGIGFTTEHHFHLQLRRALLLDQLMGGDELLTRELGQSLILSGELPKVFAL